MIKYLPNFAEVSFPSIVDETLNPRWKFGIAAQYTVLRYYREMLAQRSVVLVNEDVEGVHQIRVAARRTRTALQTFRVLWHQDDVKGYLKYLSRFADAFGTARDLDVMLIYLQKELDQARGDRRAALKWLYSRNQSLRLAEQPKLESAILRAEDDNTPQHFVDYFSTIPIDLWKVGEVYGQG